MPLVLILLLQQPFGPPVPASLRPSPPRPASGACVPAATAPDTITVCARRGPDQRVTSLPDTRPAAADALSFRLPGGGRAALGAVQGGVGGFTAPRVNATLRIPFGRGKRN